MYLVGLGSSYLRIIFRLYCYEVGLFLSLFFHAIGLNSFIACWAFSQTALLFYCLLEDIFVLLISLLSLNNISLLIPLQRIKTNAVPTWLVVLIVSWEAWMNEWCNDNAYNHSLFVKRRPANTFTLTVHSFTVAFPGFSRSAC